MTRIKKIIMLQTAGCDIDYHYRCGEKYKRLVIDKIENLNYNDTSRDQALAGLEIDDLFTEAFEND